MTDDVAKLIVIAGLPGTGKTTLARSISQRIGACYIRVDAIETAIARINGPVTGPEGYAVAVEVSRSNLLIGQSVVVDAVCPVIESRTAWANLAVEASASLTIFETHLTDLAEHEQRVIARVPDIPGQHLPTWDSVQSLCYQPWDTTTDGDRFRVDTSNSEAAVRSALSALQEDEP
ncbi:AAA family ATPase [Arthrobacter sp. Soil782]|uniref:AAA family ATPase n=1 Tax=Arthrobacter sp. Soil782 TaxID=1736410 RepID=UPI0006FB0D47|nr:AAA family ATPase [Arthrobacter sp. Soil782]